MSSQPAPGLRLKELAPGDLQRWNAFVEGCPEAGFFHRAEWRDVLEEGLGYETFFVLAERGDRIEGVLPLAHVESRVFGAQLVSLPLCERAGAAAVTDEARNALELGACELAVSLRACALELRGREQKRPQWASKGHFTLVTPLKRGSASGQGQQDLEPSPDLQPRSSDEIDLFYRRYAQGAPRRGLPPLPRAYFEHLKQAFGAECRVLVLQRKGQTLGAVLSLWDRDRLLPCYADAGVAADPGLFQALLQHAAEQGMSRMESATPWMTDWLIPWQQPLRLERRPLHYEYFPVTRDEPSSGRFPRPRLGRALELWRSLPGPMARPAGGLLARVLV